MECRLNCSFVVEAQDCERIFLAAQKERLKYEILSEAASLGGDEFARELTHDEAYLDILADRIKNELDKNTEYSTIKTSTIKNALVEEMSIEVDVV